MLSLLCQVKALAAHLLFGLFFTDPVQSNCELGVVVNNSLTVNYRLLFVFVVFNSSHYHLSSCDVATAGILGTSELWDKQEKELLENLPADTRQDYGEDYLLGLKSYLPQLVPHCNTDLSPVLSAILHALLARRPHGLYTPGRGAYIFLCIFCYFPLWFYDFFSSRMPSTESVPRALRTWEAERKHF